MTILSQLWKSRRPNREYRFGKPRHYAPKFRVLFLCTRNSDRSIFAEYFLRSMGGDRFEVYSGGEAPAGEVHPFVPKFFAKTSKSMHRRSKQVVARFTDIHFDFVITVCDDARAEPGFLARLSPPTGASRIRRLRWFGRGNAAVPADAFQVKRRIELLNCLPIEKLDHLQREVGTRQIQDDAPKGQI